MSTKHAMLAALLSLATLCPAYAESTYRPEFMKALWEHAGYISPMLQWYLDSPEVSDIAKVAFRQQFKEIATNTGIVVTYESLVLSSNGAICTSPVANLVAVLLQQPDGKRGPVMFNPGTLLYVNSGYFRDLCVTYKTAPGRVLDLYNEHMYQIKLHTGGAKDVFEQNTAR